MGLQNNFVVQTRDAILMANLYRSRGLNMLKQANENGSAQSRMSGNCAVKLADKALAVFREALRLLPDIKAAIVVKRNGDVRLFECGRHSLTV